MRMIDADALSRIVKLAWDTSDSKDFEKSVFIAIATAPTIEERKTGEWIPCSERLPELDEAVLATTAWNDITIAWRIGISEWFIHEGNTNAETADVLAWMPLPLPYKGGQE